MRIHSRSVALAERISLGTLGDYELGLLYPVCQYGVRRLPAVTFCQKETFKGKGGQAAFRTSKTERNDVELLRKKWGDVFNFGGHSGTRKRDYAGVQKITLSLPF